MVYYIFFFIVFHTASYKLLYAKSNGFMIIYLNYEQVRKKQTLSPSQQILMNIFFSCILFILLNLTASLLFSLFSPLCKNVLYGPPEKIKFSH